MPTSEAYPGTQAVSRALALLKSFSDKKPELSLAELAQQLKLNKTTVYRLLSALEHEGLVVRSSRSDAYRLGPEMIVLGRRAIRANDLRTVSQPELKALAEQTRETATLEVLSDGQVLTLDEVSGQYLIGVAQDIGSRWPLHTTSTGKALLAYLPPAKRDALLRLPLARFTAKTITEPELLHEELTIIREQGYAVADEELEIGFIALGAPVFNHTGDVVAAISIGGPTARLTQDKVAALANLVKETAKRISLKLGSEVEQWSGGDREMIG